VLAKRRAVTRYMALAGKASVVVVTLGLVEAWYDRVLGLYLNFPPLKACAEREPTRYELHTLDYNEVVQAFEGIIELLRRFGQPGVRIMLTVSPVALSSTFTDADALVANCYSKSVQRAAAEYLYRTHDMVEYFPSYESVTLSDRSSAWLEDLAHASDEVVRLNVVRMMRAYTSGGAQPGGEAFDETALATALNLSKEAEALAAAGDIEAAERLFVEATGMAANEGIVFLRYGSFLFKLGRVRDADRVLARAVELDVGRFGAHFSLGQVKFHRGDFQSAEVQLRRAIELEPGRGGIAHLLARCVAKQGRHADAFELYRAAVLCAPANEVALREFIALVDSSVEADQAIELLTTLLDNPDASRVVPQLLLELKQHAALRSGPAELERQVA